jgi:hypothetical protein
MRTNPFAKNISALNQIGVELLITDAKTALTFLDLAETSKIAESRSRWIREAHRAYQTILHLAARLSLSEEQREILNAQMKTLKHRLRAAEVQIG